MLDESGVQAAVAVRWPTVALGDVAELRRDSVEPDETTRERYVGLEHIDPAALRVTRCGSPSDVRSTKFEFRSGDVLYAKLRPYLDKGALAQWEGICSTDILVIRPGDRLDSRYLALTVHLPAFLTYAVSTMSGVNHPRTSWESLKRFNFPLPPIAEQRAIAAVVWSIDYARESTQRFVAAMRDLQRSLVGHLFRYGPVPVAAVAEVALQPSPLGPVPSDWKVVELQDLILDGPQNGLYKPATEYGSGHMIVRIDDFGADGEILQVAGSRVRVSSSELEKYALRPDDLLFNRVNSLPDIGKVALVGTTAEPLIFESNMMRFAVDSSRVLPEFVLRWLSTPAVRLLVQGRAKRAVAQSSVNQGDLRTLPCPLPSLQDQLAIVQVLRAVDRKMRADLRWAKSLVNLQSSVVAELLSRRRTLGSSR